MGSAVSAPASRSVSAAPVTQIPSGPAAAPAAAAPAGVAPAAVASNAPAPTQTPNGAPQAQQPPNAGPQAQTPNAAPNVAPTTQVPNAEANQPVDPNKPADLTHLANKGDLNYYQQRAEDFKKRNPGQEPPDYYLQYGDKYAKRFTSELRPTLSEGGQKWLDGGRQKLQQAIENKRMQDPKAFAELERNPDAFKKFAYETHAGAYLGAGLADLPKPKSQGFIANAGDIATGLNDYRKILSTPDFKDLAGSWNGVKQVGEIGAGVVGRWITGAK